jgi:hypothetical protein
VDEPGPIEIVKAFKSEALKDASDSTPSIIGITNLVWDLGSWAYLKISPSAVLNATEQASVEVSIARIGVINSLQ